MISVCMTLYCDGLNCHTIFDLDDLELRSRDELLASLEEAAKKRGWIFKEDDQFCPKCAEQPIPLKGTL